MNELLAEVTERLDFFVLGLSLALLTHEAVLQAAIGVADQALACSTTCPRLRELFRKRAPIRVREAALMRASIDPSARGGWVSPMWHSSFSTQYGSWVRPAGLVSADHKLTTSMASESTVTAWKLGMPCARPSQSVVPTSFQH